MCEYYEKLYKDRRDQTKTFMYVSNNKEDKIFNDFKPEDTRYWVEDEPKLVRPL